MNISSIGKKQLSVLDLAASTTQKFRASKYADPASPWLWLTAWAPNLLGAKYLRYLSKEQYRLAYIIKSALGNIVSLLKYENGYDLHGQIGADTYDTMIVSWCLKTDFDPRGNYKDRYFRVSSEESPGVLWFLIAVDSSIPDTIPNNVVILTKARRTVLNTTKFFFKLFIPALLKSGLHWKRMAHSLMADTLLAKAYAREVMVVALRQGDLKKIIQPYEAQPFQNEINVQAKHYFPGIETVGYIHSTLPALPSSLMSRIGGPDTLFVHGIGQAEIMYNYLGWSQVQVHCIPSLRYRKNDTANFSGWIFLPYEFDEAAVIIAAFEAFLEAQSPMSLPNLVPRCHPVRLQSNAHLELMEQLNAILKQYADRFSPSSDRQFSVFIGATSAVIEALEKGIEAAHISSNPVFETFQPEVWTYIEVDQLGPHTFVYKLKQKGAYIELGEDSSPFFNEIIA